MGNVVSVKNLTKKFGNFTALNNVNLEINEGDIYGFIGPNGAGKTTTIRVILGILNATHGSVTVFGKDAWDDAVEIHKRIAYVPGDVSLWDNLTGGEVIDLFVKMQGTKNKEKREELIKKFDFDPTKKCSTYSKGNRQKVALIAASASDADLYILDEPTSGLDPLMEKVFRECVWDLKKQKKTILLSSHILSEVEELCDKVSIIRQGEIVETGSLKDLRHLMRTNIKVETTDKLEGLEKQKGVYDVEKDDNECSFSVDNNELSNLIAYLGKHDIKHLLSAPPSLEELFMTHYKNDGDE